MKYMGSKNRHAKEILPIMLESRHPDQWYVEPFCGGCNVIDKVEGKRIANDIHYYLFCTLTALSHGWVPPVQVSEQEYTDVKKDPTAYNPALVGYIGFQLSYGAKWFGGYRRDSIGKRDYGKEAYRNVMKQIPGLQGIVFYNRQYFDLPIPPESIIYCDPPYAGTTKYKDTFDHPLFWQWVRAKSSQGHKVFVSEYNAPSDFECLWEKEVNNTLVRDTGSKQGVERLFRLRL